MRLIISRVSRASVKAKGGTVGQIAKGLFVLLGVKKGDTEKNAEELAEKLSKLRVMADKEAKMNLSVKDIAGEILVVSQFTLYADTSGGNRPSFIQAAEPEIAKRIYEKFVREVREKGIKVETGSFGDYMEIEAFMDGPVTILLE
ncbi:MAG: D-tyrosyl-tRNA(Tyr) deacylase [Candidatus Woesebacteria bacterium GW2011_GWA2_44_33]|uniref:D-aminoacyl-tRNA deacylase n=3 Tax=Microgenomates group TaxID=1794810 RepID=A0A0G1NBG4_9BACT|nr:MAG: D-tyrosyl-tRNA(Tyr) deacylase [Candidatus Curtissbacteria bacterium GW2011_GWC1_44_33]KKT67170.1 MAG: D-tyrosyl-tRNA(Tyr) deacylase [Candidatus Woesebacteria bacterium GW2011_GWA2_44_33]KKU17682.1 MAG: D-tyrosyl-tRNA(Tyr) deacylase [Candidatus Woesebacteria bacterium GW2011_GWC2_45_9]